MVLSGENKLTFLKHVMFVAGQVLSRLIPLQNKSCLFFFFPFYHTGGAEKVHSDVVSCFAGERPYVFFTGRSEDRRFLQAFSQNSRVFDISKIAPAVYFTIGFLSGYINRYSKAVVFGCNTPIFYGLLPHLKAEVKAIDLVHAFGSGYEQSSLPVVALIEKRIVISSHTVSDFASLYEANGVDAQYMTRICHIDNFVQVPPQYPLKTASRPLSVIYVGRGTSEKRVNLVGKIATMTANKKIEAEFTLVGDTRGAISYEDLENCRFAGRIDSDEALAEIYDAADILLITSSREGMPIVVMEAMAHGVIPVCTDVGGISCHVKHSENGFLTSNLSEDDVVESISEVVSLLSADRALRAKVSRAAYDYAKNNFQRGDFCKKYRRVLLDEE